MTREEVETELEHLKALGVNGTEVKYLQSESIRLDLEIRGEDTVNREEFDGDNFISALQEALERLGVPQYSFEEISTITNFENRIGTGGNGEVFLGSFRGLECSLVAVKRVCLVDHPEEHSMGSSVGTGLDEGARMRRWIFFRALDMLIKCKHSHVVELKGYAFHPTFQYGYLLTEYLEHGNTHDRLAELSWLKRVQIALDTANALDHLHSLGVIHRDIKCANVGLDENDRGKLLDFDLVKAMDENVSENIAIRDKTRDDIVPGTPGYKDPCYLLLQLSDRYLSDIYSFGVFLMEILTGKISCDPALRAVENKYFVVSEVKHEFEQYSYRSADSRIEWSRMCLIKLRELILGCLNTVDPNKRPKMNSIVVELEDIVNQNYGGNFT